MLNIKLNLKYCQNIVFWAKAVSYLPSVSKRE